MIERAYSQVLEHNSNRALDFRPASSGSRQAGLGALSASRDAHTLVV